MTGIRKPMAISLAFVAATVWLWMESKSLLPKFFCPFHWLTGIPCPGCGGTRAAIQLLHGNLLAALKINPLSVIFCLFLLAILASAWWDFLKGTNYLRTLTRTRWPNYITFPILGVILAVWIRNICIGL